jgi:aromatase
MTERYAEHGTEIPAPAGFLYGLVADATAAPLVFPGTVHVEYLTHTETEERLRIWAVNGENTRNWTSHRRIDKDGMRVTFQQEKPAPPVASMIGQWQVEALAEARAKVTLSHTYEAVDEQGEAWIANLVDTVSSGQLVAMTEFAALGTPRHLTESAELHCSPAQAYEFVADPEQWPDAGVPVEQVKCRDTEAGIQLLDMMTASGEQSTARVAFKNSHIAFKVLRGGPAIASHTGMWTFQETKAGCQVTVRHKVAAANPNDMPANTATETSTAVLRHLTRLRPTR